jgi:hypothetical protein
MKKFEKLWKKVNKNENYNIVEITPDGVITRRFIDFKLEWKPANIACNFEGTKILKLNDFLKIFKKFKQIIIHQEYIVVDGVRVKPATIDEYYPDDFNYPTEILKSYEIPDISDIYFCVYKKYDNYYKYRSINFRKNEAAATDVKQLIVKKIDCNFDDDITVDFDYLELIKSGFILNKTSKETCQIIVDDEKIDFRIKEIFNKQFPIYDDIIPEINSNTHNLKIDDKILNTMKKAKDFNMDYMHIEKNEIRFKKFNYAEGDTLLFIDIFLDLNIELSLNFKQILEVLKNGIDPVMHINGGSKPVVMTGNNKKYIVMPLKA